MNLPLSIVFVCFLAVIYCRCVKPFFLFFCLVACNLFFRLYFCFNTLRNFCFCSLFRHMKPLFLLLFSCLIWRQEPVTSESSAHSNSNGGTVGGNANGRGNRGGGLGTNSMDRTTSLEALSLLELPHLQGMTNLAALGLWPAFPSSSGAPTPGTTHLTVRQLHIQQMQTLQWRFPIYGGMPI